MSKPKSKWQLKKERLEETDTYYRMIRRIENGDLYERIAFMELKRKGATHAR